MFCTIEGCGRPHKARGYCSVHYQQFKRGVPITTEIATRGRYDGLTCSAVDCDGEVKAHGLCKRHYARLRRHGDPEHQRVAATCSVDGCDIVAHAKGLCTKHYYRDLRTGSLERSTEFVRKRCAVGGCENMAIAKDLCQTHYKRMQRHSHVLDTRAADWGSREKHPLFDTWKHLTRYRTSNLCERWTDLWNFVSDIGESRPSAGHLIKRKIDTEPFGPDNFYWSEPAVSGNDENVKAARRDYMRSWYAANREKSQGLQLKRHYGIGFDEYKQMFESQDGKCAICRGIETRVDHRTKKVSRLAVDHDHKTGAIRGLLCHSCNNALGSFKDDRDLLRAAVAYLDLHSSRSLSS